MGKTITPKYKVEVRNAGCATTPCGWDGKHAGRANAKNLEAWVTKYNESLKPGGVNEHLTEAYGEGAVCIYARLSNNLTNETVAEVTASYDGKVIASTSPKKARRVTCDQCDVLVINGLVCHEHGCPNAKK